MEENETPEFFEERDLFGQVKPKVKPLPGIEMEEEADDLNEKYAGLGVRILAYIIDALVMFIPVLFIETLLFPHDEKKDHPLEVNLLSLAMWALYYGFTESSFLQGTIGKKVFKLKVIDKHGNKLTFLKAALRYLAQIISILPLGFGLWAIEKNKKKQAWHDEMVGCYVVYEKTTTE